MPRSPRFRPPAWHMALVTALALTPAHAFEDEELLLKSPRSGDVYTVVTGQGPAASVAEPDYPAAMSPRWLVARSDIDWNCPDSNAVSLEVRTRRGPNARPRVFDLRTYGLHGASTQLELYLWEVSEVKAACTRDGEVRVNSVPVKLTLRCEKGQVLQHSQVVAIQVQCQSSAPSVPAGTGLTDPGRKRNQAFIQDSRSTFSGMTADPSPSELSLGKKSTVEFPNVLRRGWMPEIQILRLVRLDAAGKILQRYPPIPLSGERDDPYFEPRLTFTPRSAGPVLFALEAEYLDGSRLLSQPSEVQVLTASQEAAKAAQVIPAPQRMAFFDELTGQLNRLGCDQALMEWLKAQPILEDAGITAGSIWYRFTDGQTGIVHCH